MQSTNENNEVSIIVTCANCVNFIIFSFRRKSRSIQLLVTVQGSNSKFNPLVAKLMDKNMSSVSVNSVWRNGKFHMAFGTSQVRQSKWLWLAQTRSNQLDLVAMYMV